MYSVLTGEILVFWKSSHSREVVAYKRFDCILLAYLIMFSKIELEISLFQGNEIFILEATFDKYFST